MTSDETVLDRTLYESSDWAMLDSPLYVRPVADRLRHLVLIVFVSWGAFYAVWPELAISQFVSLGPIGVSITDILILLSIVFGISDALAIVFDRSRASAVRVVALTVCLYLLYILSVVTPFAVISGLGSTVAMRMMASRFTVLVAPMTAGLLYRRPHSLGSLLATPALVSIVPAVGGIVRAMTGQVVSYAGSGESRFRALWGGTSLLFAWPVFVVTWAKTKSSLPKVMAAVGVLGLFLANHRSSYIAILACLPVVFRSENRTLRRVIIGLSIAAMIFLAALAVTSVIPSSAIGYSFKHLFDYETGTGADRLMRWQGAWRIVTSDPFKDILWTSPGSAWSLLSDAYIPHNWLLEVGVTEGIVPLVLYLVIIFNAFRAAWPWRREPLAAGVFAYGLFYVVFSTFNANFYNLACSPLFWMACGLMMHVSDLHIRRTT